MVEPTLYLFDGYNLLHAAGMSERSELVDRLAGYLALRGARGVVVFDGVGEAVERGPLEVRFASPADSLLERLAAEHRGRGPVVLVSSDRVVLATAGQEVRRRPSQSFLEELAGQEAGPAPAATGSRVEDALDEATRERLERWRRRRD